MNSHFLKPSIYGSVDIVIETRSPPEHRTIPLPNEIVLWNEPGHFLFPTSISAHNQTKTNHGCCHIWNRFWKGWQYLLPCSLARFLMCYGISTQGRLSKDLRNTKRAWCTNHKVIATEGILLQCEKGKRNNGPTRAWTADLTVIGRTL